MDDEQNNDAAVVEQAAEAEQSAEASQPEDAQESAANAQEAGSSSEPEPASADAPAANPLAENAAPGDLVHVVAPGLGVVGLFKVVAHEAEHLAVCALDREHEIAHVAKADVKGLFVHVEAIAEVHPT